MWEIPDRLYCAAMQDSIVAVPRDPAKRLCFATTQQYMVSDLGRTKHDVVFCGVYPAVEEHPGARFVDRPFFSLGPNTTDIMGLYEFRFLEQVMTFPSERAYDISAGVAAWRLLNMKKLSIMEGRFFARLHDDGNGVSMVVDLPGSGDPSETLDTAPSLWKWIRAFSDHLAPRPCGLTVCFSLALSPARAPLPYHESTALLGAVLTAPKTALVVFHISATERDRCTTLFGDAVSLVTTARADSSNEVVIDSRTRPAAIATILGSCRVLLGSAATWTITLMDDNDDDDERACFPHGRYRDAFQAHTSRPMYCPACVPGPKWGTHFSLWPESVQCACVIRKK